MMNAAYTGIHPETDPDDNPWPEGSDQEAWAGKPLCEGKWRFVCWNLTGDLEFLSNELKMPHVGSNYPCWFDSVCRDPSSDCLLTDLAGNARWKRTLIPCPDGCCVQPSHHTIFQIHGLTRYHVPGDLMHTGDLGVVANLNGSVLWELLYDGPYRGNEDARLASIENILREHYERRGSTSRIGRLANNCSAIMTTLLH